MRLLLDTHTVIWFLLGDRHLSHAARRAIENSRNDVFASAVSGYEIANKSVRAGIDPIVLRELSSGLRSQRLNELAVTVAHAIAAAELPGPHRDPWDRILMAQAKEESLILVTCDPVFEQYRMRVLW